jgi:hypothetical protein
LHNQIAAHRGVTVAITIAITVTIAITRVTVAITVAITRVTVAITVAIAIARVTVAVTITIAAPAAGVVARCVRQRIVEATTEHERRRCKDQVSGTHYELLPQIIEIIHLPTMLDQLSSRHRDQAEHQATERHAGLPACGDPASPPRDRGDLAQL